MSDTHILHRADDPTDCSECEINRAHVARFTDENRFSFDMGDENRKDWDRFYSSHSPAEPARRNKSNLLTKFVTARHGSEVTLDELMEAGACASGTAYAFVAANPLSFRKVNHGVWLAIDPALARAAAKASGSAPTMPADVLGSIGAATTPTYPQTGPQGPIPPPPRRTFAGPGKA